MFKLIAGPCVVESEETTFKIANRLKTICSALGIKLIFKASYRKANRTNSSAFEGIGDFQALTILKKVRDKLNLSVITDVHTPFEAIQASDYVSMLQIPALLCRQTELIETAAKTGLPINIKKGQFASTKIMEGAILKAKNAGGNEIMITERGTTFGYSDLIVDMRNIPIMKKFNVPVIVDITHSTGLQDGNTLMIETLGKCAIAAGADGIFLETHPFPSTSQSDGNRMLNLDNVFALLIKLQKIHNAL